MARYLGLFAQESIEHLEELGREIVRLEGERDPEAVNSMFRHAHSVKGMAASMGFTGIATLAHRTEDVVDGLRKSDAPAQQATVDALLAASDRLLEMVRVAATGEDPPPPGPILEKLDALLGPAPQARVMSTRLRVDVTIAPTCQTPGVRAFLVHKKLSLAGHVVTASPSLEDCKAGRIPGGKLSAVVETEADPARLRALLDTVADLVAVDVQLAPAEPVPPPPAPSSDGEDERRPSTVKVKTEVLDWVLDSVGELLIATARLRELVRSIPERDRPPVEEGAFALHRLVKDLHGRVMTMRMTPVSLVLDRLPRAARDAARSLGREVEVVLEGAEIELDRAILEELADALPHVVRNAVDHGIESLADRRAAGKPARGSIRIGARRDRDRVVIEIEDDGRGMDPDALRQSAVLRGALSEAAASALPDREALLLACLPGISTRAEVSDLSGRGVGLDAVKRTVESLGGELEIDSSPGRGTRLSLRLPLTVAVVPVLLVAVGTEVFGVPIAKVVGAVEAGAADLKQAVGSPLLSFGGEMLPVLRLSDLVQMPPADAGSSLPHLVIESDSGRLALQVEALLGQEEAVLKPVGSPLDRIPGLAGVTILGTGRPVFVLDVPRLPSA